MLVILSVFHVCLIEAWMCLNKNGYDDNFYKMRVEEFNKEMIEKKISHLEADKLYLWIWKNFRSFYLYMINNLSFQYPIGIDKPTFVYIPPQIIKKIQLQGLIKQFRNFGSGNVVIFNTLMILFDLW